MFTQKHQRNRIDLDNNFDYVWMWDVTCDQLQMMIELWIGMMVHLPSPDGWRDDDALTNGDSALWRGVLDVESPIPVLPPNDIPVALPLLLLLAATPNDDSIAANRSSDGVITRTAGVAVPNSNRSVCSNAKRNKLFIGSDWISVYCIIHNTSTPHTPGLMRMRYSSLMLLDLVWCCLS